MADRVRGHTRRKPGGGATRVQQHTRRSRPRKPLVSGRHAWHLIKRGYRASKRKKKAAAATLLTLGALEGTFWLTMNGLRLVFFTAGVVCIGFAALTTMAGGGEGS